MAKVALITGSAAGFGKAFAEALLKRGHKVLLSDINETVGTTTCQEFAKSYGQQNVQFVKCDVTRKEDFTSLFPKAKDAFGSLDIVCNNAGIIHETEWEKMMEINLLAMIRGTKLGIEHMGKDRGGNGGVIVNVSSAAGLQPVAFAPGYCASKYGVVGFTRSAAIHPDFLKHQVRINCLCPFFAQTDILKLTREQVMGMTLAKETLKATGIIELERVVDGFIELVGNEDLNGAVMKITVKKSKLVDFPPHGFEFLTQKSSL